MKSNCLILTFFGSYERPQLEQYLLQLLQRRTVVVGITANKKKIPIAVYLSANSYFRHITYELNMFYLEIPFRTAGKLTPLLTIYRS